MRTTAWGRKFGKRPMSPLAARRAQIQVIKRRATRSDMAWLAGLLDGRGVVEVGRYYPKGRCKILPDISIDFNIQHNDVAEHAAVMMGGVTKRIKGGRRILAFVRGWAKVAALAEAMGQMVNDPVKACRLATIAERARRPNPSVSTDEERGTPLDKLSEVFFSDCPKPLRAYLTKD